MGREQQIGEKLCVVDGFAVAFGQSLNNSSEPLLLPARSSFAACVQPSTAGGSTMHAARPPPMDNHTCRSAMMYSDFNPLTTMFVAGGMHAGEHMCSASFRPLFPFPLFCCFVIVA
jgi:hypothetical protein